MNDAYAELIAQHPKRFKGFASIPMDAPDAALQGAASGARRAELNGVILLSNIRGRRADRPAVPAVLRGGQPRRAVHLPPPDAARRSAEPFGEYVLGPIVGFPFDTTLAVARMCFDGMLQGLPGHPLDHRPSRRGGAVPDGAAWTTASGTSPSAGSKIDELPSAYLKRLYYDTVTFSPPHPEAAARPGRAPITW